MHTVPADGHRLSTRHKTQRCAVCNSPHAVPYFHGTNRSTACSGVSPCCTPRTSPFFSRSSRRQLYTVFVDKPNCSHAALTPISSANFSTSALYSALYFCPISCLPFPFFFSLGVRFYYITPPVLLLIVLAGTVLSALYLPFFSHSSCPRSMRFHCAIPQHMPLRFRFWSGCFLCILLQFWFPS